MHSIRSLAVILVLVSGCAAHTRPAQSFVPVGVQLVATVGSVRETVLALGKSGLISPDQERKAVESITKAEGTCKQLVVTLQALDQAQTALEQTKVIVELTTLLHILNELVFEILAPFSDVTVRLQIAGLLREVNALMLTLSGAVLK